jgi:hypothetical protein
VNLTWAQIKQFTIDACGNPTSINQEIYAHLTEGHNHVCAQVDVPDLVQSADVVIPTDPMGITTYLDYIELDPTVYHLDSVKNKTDGYPVIPEPSGMLGRDRYLTAGTGRPPTGSVRNYWRDGNRVYLRDTPTKSTTLTLRYRMEPADIDATMLNLHPLPPAHYDWAIIFAAAMNYYMAHPTEEGAADKVQQYQASMNEKLQAPKQVMVEEDRPRYQRMRLAGYRCSPRTRRW